MNADIACASSAAVAYWDQIDWKRCERQVTRLQPRIVKASRERRWGKVKALQRLLTCSFSGKALAVKRVTENKGKRTSGVDHVLWPTPQSKLKAIASLQRRGYRPLPLRRVYIPKSNGKLRPLSIPVMKDRAMQALYLMALEPVTETCADPNSYGFRKGRSTADAIEQCFKFLSKSDAPEWILEGDIRGCFDHISHRWLLTHVPMDTVTLEKWLRCGFLENSNWFATEEGTPQGGIISPLLSNIYLTEVDRMLERAKETTRNGKYTYVEYARFADDLVVLIDAHPRNAWLLGAVNKRLREEFAKLQVEINEEKSHIVELDRGESFGFLGFDFRRLRGIGRRVWRAHYTPKMKKRTALLRKLKDVFRRFQSQPVDRVVQLINLVLRGWVNYFAVGHSSECFSFIKDWVEKKIRRHMGRSRNRRGFGWKRWSRHWLYEDLKLFNGYRVRRLSMPKALPA